jgi:ATP-dependent exoDNAse (exonuclease V) beta subunit
MPRCSNAKNPHGIEILFEEESHKYTSIINGKEINYISGTTFIGNFFPKFDPTGEITKKCAQKRGITVESLKAQWKEKSDNSCKFGTKIHETCEDILLNNALRNEPFNERERLSMEVAKKAASKILEKCSILGIEKIIFDETLKIAGTMDLFVKSKKDGKLWIIDWKTNEKIETENIYNNYGLYPIKHIPSTNYGHYDMQLNLYEFILKKVGYVDKCENIGKCLIHITDKGSKTYLIDTHQKEISDMINIYTKENL